MYSSGTTIVDGDSVPLQSLFTKQNPNVFLFVFFLLISIIIRRIIDNISPKCHVIIVIIVVLSNEMINLGSIEVSVNFIIWSSGVVYSLYNLYLVGNEFNHGEHNVYFYDDFTPGWFGRFQDTSDFEWACWTHLSITLLPWLVINSVGGLLLASSSKYKNIVSLWYLTISLIATANILSAAVAGLFVTITLLFHLSVYLKSPILIWIVGVLWRKYVPSHLLAKTESELYLIEVASSWLILRCFAYSLEVLKGAQPSVSVLFGYALYLPTLFCGPFLTLPSFLRNLITPVAPWTTSRMLVVLRSFTRCIFWYLFTTVALHFVYVNAILLRPYMVVGMSVWQLAGLGIAMGHFFHLKYVVFYGLPSCWAAIEGYSTPKPPCCVSRVYLYSVMWRNFDPGLYSFLVRYIYVPVLMTLQGPRLLVRTAASVACFFFVFVWHGGDEYVFYWVLLNFAAVTVEALAREIYNIPSVKRLLQSLNSANRRRLHCLLASPLHYFSMISNYFFIGSMEIGKIYFNRAIRESGVNTSFILFFLYGAAQTTVSIEMWEKQK